MSGAVAGAPFGFDSAVTGAVGAILSGADVGAVFCVGALAAFGER